MLLFDNFIYSNVQELKLEKEKRGRFTSRSGVVKEQHMSYRESSYTS
jgi:hypothetical protein